MDIDTLIQLLEDARDEVGGDAQVRFASQPSWPFEYSISDNSAVSDGVFYLAEFQQVGYLPGDVREQIGW